MKTGYKWLLIPIALAGTSTGNAQQSYPTQPVRVVVFVPAGGAADLLARVLSQKLGDALGQTFVVENRAGAGGTIAANLVAKATPDGYTLLQGGITTHGIGPHIYSNLTYDPVKDFSPVVLSATMPIFLVVNAQVPVKSVSELIALAKSRPEQISYSYGGSGSAPHLVSELFKMVTGVPSQAIAYKGSAPAATALAGGHVQFMFDAIAGHQAHIQSGRTKALAVVSPKRVAAYPDTPTMNELGYPRVAGSIWYGLLATAGTRKDIVARLNAESNRILAMQDVKDRLATAGIDAAGGTPEEFGKFIQAELTKWGPVVKAAGVKAD